MFTREVAGTLPSGQVEKSLNLPESRWVDVDGPVHYRVWAGPPGLTFVCVHGLGGSHLNWAGVAPGLSRWGRVLTPDLAGFGLTPQAGRGSGLMANRRLVSAFIRATSPDPVVLVGNSMGAAVALLQAAAEPGSTAGLVLTSPALPWVGLARPDPVVVVGFALYRVPRLGEWVARQRAARLGPEGLVRQTLQFCSPHPEAIDPALVEAHIELARQRASMPEAVPAFLEAVRSLFLLARRRDRVREVLNRVSCPVLLLHGRRDRLVPVELARSVARAQPGWRFRILEDVGHVAQMEVPDRWLRAVEEWMPTVGGAPPERLARTGPPAR